MTDELPEEIQHFIEEHVRTPEQLEALLLLRQASGRLFSADALAQELGISVTAATIALTRLDSHQLLVSRTGSQSRFKYGPATAALANAVDLLAARYQTHRLQVLSQLAANAAKRAHSEDLATFAAAFVVRGKPDG